MPDRQDRVRRFVHQRRDDALGQQDHLPSQRQQAEQAADRQLLQAVDGLRRADERRVVFGQQLSGNEEPFMARSLFALLNRRYGPKIDGATRREFLKATLAASAGLLLSRSELFAQTPKKVGLRVAV